jgi:two-component system chemotaxis sensor kinase CheA
VAGVVDAPVEGTFGVEPALAAPKETGYVNDMDEIVQEFLVESHENLDQLDRDLVALEQDPNSRDRLSSIFRTIHTIKGTSGFLAFAKLERVTHVGESVLSRLRDGKLALTPEMTTALLQMVDAVRAILASIERTGLEGDADHTALIATLTQLQDGPAPDPSEQAPREVDDGRPLLGDLLIKTGKATEEDIHFAIREQEIGDPRHIGEILVEQGVLEPGEVAEVLSVQGDVTPQRSIYESTLRVDVALLDDLMNLVGELVLTRNQIVAKIAGLGDPTLLRASQRLNVIATELQAGVMASRMQPINMVWQKIPRIVRDICVNVSKSVQVEMEGQDTELDKTIIEAINAPLTHLVRNAVDHGIETPEVRTAAGKPADGIVSLRARHESGSVTIEIADDGAGVNLTKVREKALQKGLVTRDTMATMSDRDIIGLIFLPGFSTAEKITNVSGRGVGMDVVRTNIEKIGGTIEVVSVTGVGTTVRIKIPLTLAIIPALSVRSGGQRYAVPQVNLLELVRLEPDEVPVVVQNVHAAPVFRLRDSLLPLIYLHERLGVESQRPADAPTYIVVLQAEDRQFGLVVDEVEDTQEIVVKALQKQIKGVGAFAGATILGDGRVSLILDVISMAAHANVGSIARDSEVSDEAAEQVETESMLITSIGADRRVAIPLDAVTRLEELPTSALEQVGPRQMLQYRGEIIPIVRICDVLNDAIATVDADAPLRVVVYRRGERTVGLIVNDILDIVEEAVQVTTDIADTGVSSTAVVQHRITELLDVRQAILAADPSFFDDTATAGV